MEVRHAKEWVQGCAARLKEQWPTVDPEALADVAFTLWNDQQWRRLEPADAAQRWLRQGVLAEA